jgi:hypothetical protein
MPRFSPNFRAALNAGRKFVPFASMAWPSGTKRYGVSPRSIGGYQLEPRLLGGGTTSSAISLKPGSLSIPEASFVLADTDGGIMRKLEAGGDPRGVACAEVWAMPGLAEVDWYTLFSGIFDRAESRDAGFSQEMFLRANDTPLRGNVDKAQFLPAEFPKAPPAVWNTFFPKIYGSYSGEDLTGKGMVPCIPWSIDAGEGYRYTPTMGFAKAIPRVYKNGTLLGLATDYELSYPIRGKQFTSIDLLAPAIPTTVDDIITCDIDGFEDVGDGTGELIVNRVDQLQHLLANFGFGDWRYGVWNDAEDYPLDLETLARCASFASSFLSDGSMRFGGDARAQTINDALQKWFGTNLVFRPFWSEQGKFAMGFIDHRFHGVGSPGFESDVDAVFVRGRVQEIGPSFEDSEDTADLISRVDMAALFGLDADGKTWKPFQNVSVEDVSQVGAGAESYSLEYSEGRLV